MTRDAADGAGDDPAREARWDRIVVGVTVTYADRAEMCIGTVTRALDAGARRVVVVDNGSSARSHSLVSALAEGQPDRVEVLSLGRNTGSARAFRRGMESALAAGADYVWLLDDDNWPSPTCGYALMRAVERDALIAGPESILVCFRPADPTQRNLVDGTVPLRAPATGAGQYFGFDYREKLRLRVTTARAASASVSDLVLNQAPYGGLFIPASAIAVIGMPDPQFVLYCDDLEYTARANTAGIKLRLVPQAVVEDATSGWRGDRASHLTNLVRGASRASAYYLLRNSLVLDRRAARLGHADLAFTINVAVVSLTLTLKALRARQPRFIGILLRALRDAIRGRMGERESLPQFTSR